MAIQKLLDNIGFLNHLLCLPANNALVSIGQLSNQILHEFGAGSCQNMHLLGVS